MGEMPDFIIQIEILTEHPACNSFDNGVNILIPSKTAQASHCSHNNRPADRHSRVVPEVEQHVLGELFEYERDPEPAPHKRGPSKRLILELGGFHSVLGSHESASLLFAPIFAAFSLGINQTLVQDRVLKDSLPHRPMVGAELHSHIPRGPERHPPIVLLRKIKHPRGRLLELEPSFLALLTKGTKEVAILRHSGELMALCFGNDTLVDRLSGGA